VISIVVPVRNDPDHLRACLTSLAATQGAPDREVIVVDDASTDDTAEVATALGARLLKLDRQVGPAAARNLGAETARGEHVFFVDADVCVHPETVGRVASVFAADPGIDALFGSYDLHPGESNFLSQYKNLFHHFVHQQGSVEASTFWSGCGAIKRSVFLEMGGFDTRYDRPCIEDIELGARLRRAGRRIVLRKDVQARHLKRWTLAGIVKSDVWDRGVPWTELILRERHLPDDLNLKLAQRVSAILAYLFAATLLAAAWRPFGLALTGWAGFAAVLLAAIVAVNRRFYAFFAHERGLMFAVRVVPLHVLYYLYSGVALAMGVVRHVWKTRFRRSAKRMKVAPGAPAP
jgi:glycosyltransferase involved in cell wall biosynthesis